MLLSWDALLYVSPLIVSSFYPRDNRLVNWDCILLTAISDIEVRHRLNVIVVWYYSTPLSICCRCEHKTSLKISASWCIGPIKMYQFLAHQGMLQKNSTDG